jgi:hypothetical protein
LLSLLELSLRRSRKRYEPDGQSRDREENPHLSIIKLPGRRLYSNSEWRTRPYSFNSQGGR